jgi:hypothetical protein
MGRRGIAESEKGWRGCAAARWRRAAGPAARFFERGVEGARTGAVVGVVVGIAGEGTIVVGSSQRLKSTFSVISRHDSCFDFASGEDITVYNCVNA